MEDRRARLKGRVVPPEVAPVWNPEARVTMENEMPAETRYNVMELISEPLRPEREASRQKIEQENKEYWSRACGLWNRPDLRPRVKTKQKRSITAPSTQANPPNAVQEQLDVAVPATTIENSSNTITGQSQTAMGKGNEGNREHSPEPPLTPASVVNLLEDDDGPHTPEDVATPETEKTEQDEQTQHEGRASLDEMREGSRHQRDRHNSAAP